MKDKPQDLTPVSRQQWQHFGALVRDRRNAAKLSRLALAHRAKISDATIKFIETARHPPSRATLIRLLDVPELHLTWADVPGHHKSLVEKPPVPTPPLQAPSAAVSTHTDLAQFMMNLLGFDEIYLPAGSPNTLRLFQQRTRVELAAENKKESESR
jgi:transcriptional regulator with XRE-family HTH domain